MGDYQRMIAYIYEYDGKVKMSNKGFVRIDVRNGYGRLYISVRNLREQNEALKYWFYEWKQGIMQSYPQGELMVTNGSSEVQMTFEPEKIGDAVTFSEMSGVLIGNGSHMYGAEWDERDINLNLLDLNGAIPIPAKELLEEDLRAAGVEENVLVEENRMPFVENWRKIFETEEILQPFDDDMMYDCVEIKPELMQFSPFTAKNLGQNSFLLHGFYSYGHLLVGKLARPGVGKRYFVGVPGIYNHKERRLASMYGFENFRKSIRRDYQQPYFGYWYSVVDDD